MDGVGSYDDAGLIAQKMQSENCNVRIFHPLPWNFLAYRKALRAGRWYSQFLYLLASINHRNHRKLCLIDNRVAWLGSYNITASHFNNTFQSHDDDWHDTGLRLSGGIVAELRENFEEVWQRKNHSVVRRAQQFLSNNTILSRIFRNRRLVNKLEKAKNRIWICNAYFNPSFKLQVALKKAAKNGIDVSLLVPSKSDVFLFPSLTRTYYADLINAGIKVYEYPKRTLHSKTMLIDNQVLIGSTNLNYRSFFHDLELDAFLTDQKSVQCMQDKFKVDFENSARITLENWGQHHWLMRMLGWVSHFFRYFL
ncbi:MAG: cardiolipin synthase [Gammaproteobacteria bacterium]|jgi:cardiolipin synthase